MDVTTDKFDVNINSIYFDTGIFYFKPWANSSFWKLYYVE